MPEITNNSKIDIEANVVGDASEKTMIAINGVGMTFNMASEQLNNLKEYFLAIVKHNLFFEELRALQDINFEVKQGDVFGIVGTNGSGKSTLLKIVAGVLEPTDGTVEINGDIAPLIELGAGFDMELSARENIYLNGALLGHSKDFINEHFDEIVEFSEIEKFLDMPMKNYSSGMIARIAFAIATVIIPEILIVDEVLSVGDFMFQKKCEDKILDLIKNHDTTVLIVSHSNDQIKRLCNKAIWIEKGHTRMLGSADAVCDVYSLVGGREGSLEAETQILEAHKRCENEDEECARQLAHGNTYPEVCLSLDRLVGQENISTVCVVSQGTHLNAVCANSFAGAKDAAVISCSAEKIDYHIIDWIESKKPDDIFVFNALHDEGGSEYATHNYSWNPNVHEIEITSDDAFEITLQFYDYLKAKVDFSDTVIVTSYADYPESSVLLSGLMTKNAHPYFCIDTLADASTTQFEKLEHLGFKKLIVAGRNVDDASFKNLELEVVNLAGNDLLNSQAKIHEHVLSTESDYFQKEAIVVPNICTMHSTGAACGYYSNEKHAHTLVVDDTELDSIAYAVKFIETNKIEKVTFLAGPGKLSQSVMDLLSKVAAGER